MASGRVEITVEIVIDGQRFGAEFDCARITRASELIARIERYAGSLAFAAIKTIGQRAASEALRTAIAG